MSLDLIEYALEHLTDWPIFEKIVVEIMEDEGYPDIKPLGGTSDEGQDAIVERFYESLGKVRTVFQVSLRKDIVSKTNETIKTLKEAKVEYTKLIMVTRGKISAERKLKLQKDVRKSDGIELEFFDFRTIVARLAVTSNNIFYRNFPDIKKQIATHIEQNPNTDEYNEEHSLRVYYAFVLHDKASMVRKSLLDQMVLSVVISSQLSSEDEICNTINSLLGEIEIQPQQLRASLKRLEEQRYVECLEDKWKLSIYGQMMLEIRNASFEKVESSVISDLADKMIADFGESVSNEEKTRIKRNSKDVLVAFFKLRGIELANTFLKSGPPTPVYEDAIDNLTGKASRGLSKDFGTVVFSTIAEALNNPSEEQAEYFANCARAYIAVQVMKLDPTIKGLQDSRIRTKKFILDTDFMLDVLVKELPTSEPNVQLIQALKDIGAEVIVPNIVLEEIANHFMISLHYFNRVASSLVNMDESTLTQEVTNALIRGYWYTINQGRISKTSFRKYQENYYDHGRGIEFIAEVIRRTLPGVEIGDVCEKLSLEITEEEIEPVMKVMIKLAGGTSKGSSRTEEETVALGSNDARLYIATSKYNSSFEQKVSILGQGVYVLTSSSRYLRASRILKSEDRVSARPEVILELLEMAGKTIVDDRSLTKLFENPLLHHAVNLIWDDLKILLDCGISIRTKSLARLSLDVEQHFHDKISSLTQFKASEKEIEEGSREIDSVYLDIVKTAKALGYPLIDIIERLVQKGELQEGKLSELAEENEEFRKAINEFGKRKERWLKRHDKKKK
ncbi:MAG: hypothetical protein E3J72_22085 [Planctomycetota bacterium]|nr:MAG: hypothetical protein E3J72_22085 [Planctomycetota bacterium]